jgi:hypothetical protein
MNGSTMITIDESIIMLEVAMRELMHFDSDQEKADFILDVVNEYKKVVKDIYEHK